MEKSEFWCYGKNEALNICPICNKPIYSGAIMVEHWHAECFKKSPVIMQRWIHIKERKPDKNDRYLVSIIFDRVEFRPLKRYKDFLVGSAIYENETWSYFRPLFYGDSINFEDWEIIAWMPLPEPYKAESEDKK